jgi:hypothetical protein
MENENNEDNENIVQKNIEVDVELLKQLRQLFEVTNSRIQWKTTELLPVGLIFQKLDILLKDK